MADTNTRSGSSAWDGSAHHGAAEAGNVSDDTAGAETAQSETAGSGVAAPEAAGDETARSDTAGSDAPEVDTAEVDTAADGADLGPAHVRTPPVTETDPLLVHVGESIDEAKEAAREVFGEHGSGSEDDVDPNLGTGAPVP
jgi:hypothetical protein